MAGRSEVLEPTKLLIFLVLPDLSSIFNDGDRRDVCESGMELTTGTMISKVLVLSGGQVYAYSEIRVGVLPL